MTLKEIVQEKYEQEIDSWSFEAKRVVRDNFADYSRLIVFHERGQNAFKTFTKSLVVQHELYELTENTYSLYVKEQLLEWKRSAIRELLSKDETLYEKIIDDYLKRSYQFLLKEESSFVQKTIKNNCPQYAQALVFVRKQKSINEFLRCSNEQRNELSAFFDRFGELYNGIVYIYNEKKVLTPQSSQHLEVLQKQKSVISSKIDDRRTKSTKKSLHVANKQKSKTSKRKHKKTQNAQDGEKRLRKKDKPASSIKFVDIDSVSVLSFHELPSPSFVDPPRLSFDDLTMVATLNLGCNGTSSFGMSPKFMTPPIGGILYNFERTHWFYDPDEEYHKPIVSDKITRSSHRYKWFGVNGYDYLYSLKYYGIIAKCINLYFGEYKCYVPVEVDDIEGEFVAEINISEETIDSILTKRKDLKDFLLHENITLRDFKLMEITSKLLYLCDYYDIYDFLDLDEELFSKQDVIVSLQAAMSKKTIDEYLWDSYTLEEKNLFLKQKVKAIRNKEAYLRFNIANVAYLPYSREFELSYLIHSEYSVVVFVNIDIIYRDGTKTSYSHIDVDAYDDKFEYFQGKMRMRSEQDYLNIEQIQLTCSDE